ncbi:MAG: hypothetical protein LBH58_10800 [Tannerellaceae bacterium]|jgi:hypothetical protein|nr:hypothetical protein [Tannerellaceae bacterium]
MEAATLYQLMGKPSQLTRETLPGLRQLVEDYPYFQSARILYLKNLAILSDISFASELKKMAIYIPDRKKLFTLIEGAQYGLKVRVKADAPGKPNNAFSLIDTFLSSHGEPGDADSSDSSILFLPSASTDYLYWSASKAPQGQQVDDETSPKLQHHELIDSFLKEDEQRIPGRGLWIDDEDGDNNDTFLSDLEGIEQKKDESQPMDEDSYFTETLARIYIKQKRYEKALQIIKNLSLKYPEKNVYFADQIRFLEKLIINTKK